jgi:hypothetical protein
MEYLIDFEVELLDGPNGLARWRLRRGALFDQAKEACTQATRFDSIQGIA